MRITLEQRGGFAGISMRRVVDTASLSADEAAEVEALAAPLWSIAADAAPVRRGYDMQTYVLTLEDGERKHALRLQDGTMPEGAVALVAWMKKVPPTE